MNEVIICFSHDCQLVAVAKESVLVIARANGKGIIACEDQNVTIMGSMFHPK
jgi:hypothetical protein